MRASKTVGRRGVGRRAVGRRAVGHQATELLLICAALSLCGVLGLRVFAGIAEAGAWWMLPVALLAGVIAADFASGAVHWFGDSFFRDDSWVIGPMLIAPFREHHRDPEGITRHGLLELHGNSAIPVVAALVVAIAVMPSLSSSSWLAVYAWLFFFAVTALATNQLHVWAHRARVPRLVAALQRARVILSPEAHARHHSGSFRRSYCITTGWLNPLLDRIDFFPVLERRIRSAMRRSVRASE